LEIERRQRLCVRNDGFDAWHRGHEADELRLNLQNHARAKARDQWCIADELDRVAEALLGMEQDGLAAERLIAEPQRRQKASAVPRERGGLPARFVAAPSGEEIAQRQLDKASHEPPFGKIRLACQRPPKQPQGLARPIEPPQRDCLIGEEPRLIGGKPQSRLVACDRLPRAIELEQRVAAIAERIHMGGIERHHAVKASERVGGATKMHERHPAPVERVGIIRRHRAGGLVARERLHDAAQAVQDEPQIRQCCGIRAVKLQSSAKERERRIEPAALIAQHAEKVQGLDMVRVVLQKRRAQPLCLEEIGGLMRTPGARHHARAIGLTRALRHQRGRKNAGQDAPSIAARTGPP
jgi:hypothetical protein